MIENIEMNSQVSILTSDMHNGQLKKKMALLKGLAIVITAQDNNLEINNKNKAGKLKKTIAESKTKNNNNK